MINKIDKKDSRANEVLDEVFDLFLTLNANNDQLDFHTYNSCIFSNLCSVNK